MTVQQKMGTAKRQDKTGTRTFPGALTNGRKQTRFDLKTYMTSWPSPSAQPGYGPLFQGALGANPLLFAGGTATANSTAMNVQFTAAHGLSVGQAIAFSGEIRFVASVIDTATVLLNSALSTVPTAGAAVGPTVTYFPATELPSLSVFDYWTPSTSVQRLLCGCAVNEMDLQVNGDYHQFSFSGMAQDLLDTSSFQSGMGMLTGYPPEPPVDPTPITVIPGHLGQVWLGPIATRFYTLTSGKINLNNGLSMRTDEYGSSVPQAINPGPRTVLLDFDLFGQDDINTVDLYQAARQRSPIAVCLQLGQSNGQLFGLYLKSVVPEVPDYGDQDSRLQWQFRGSQAQGSGDDEIVVAFG